MKTLIPPIRPTAVVTELHRLAQMDGQSCRGHLTELEGRLYGLAGECGPLGTLNCNSSANWNTAAHTKQCPGSLFSIGLDGSDFRVDHAFTWLDDRKQNPDGYHPYGSMVALNGWLYGTTQMGGAAAVLQGYVPPGFGVLFRYSPTIGAFETLHSFFVDASGITCQYPMGVLAVGPNGIYGTCKAGGLAQLGAVWRWRDGVLVSRSMSGVAGIPYGGLTWAHGKLHGTSSHSAAGDGTYFTVDPETLEVAVVDTFDTFIWNTHGTDNTSIQAPLLLSDGALVTARQYGGPHGTGFVARLDEDGITVLCECEDIPLLAVPRFSNRTGAMLNGSLCEGADGMIYGTGAYGGVAGTGGVYRIARDGSRFELVHSFDLAGPNYPYGGLTRASNGGIYLVTFNAGAILRIDPPTV